MKRDNETVNIMKMKTDMVESEKYLTEKQWPNQNKSDSKDSVFQPFQT